MTIISPCFNLVQSSRVVDATATIGQLDNSRVWVGSTAQELTEFLKSQQGEFTASDSIQMWSWDFINNKPLKITPLVFSFAVKEEWLKEERIYNRFTVFTCYDVGKDEYHCRQYQGSSGDFYLASHSNSIVLSKEVGDSLVNKILSTPSSKLVYRYQELPFICRLILKFLGEI